MQNKLIALCVHVLSHVSLKCLTFNSYTLTEFGELVGGSVTAGLDRLVAGSFLDDP